MIQYIIAAGVGALLGSQGKKSRKKYAQGGEVTADEALAKAEYLEDYGVDAGQLEDQYLGEWDSPEDFVESWIEDTGGMEGLINPERFYRIDKFGFRQFAQEEADMRSADIDEDNAEEYAEKFNLEIEYEDAVEADKLDDFIQRLQEEEEASVYDDFMANYTTADEIINDLGPNYGMSIEDLERAYLIEPDYTAIADAFEDDGYVYIKKGGKTFVFNYNMKRGGRTKKCMSCGGTTHAKGGTTDKSLERALGRFRAQREASELRDAQARERRMIRQHQSGMSAGAFAKGGKTGRETITYNVYNANGNVIRSAESIADFDEGTITLPNGKKFKVKPDLDFTMKFQKTQIKAKDGLEGLVRNIKEFSSPDSAFNLLYAEKFAPREMKKGGTTKKPRKQVSDFDKLAMKVAAGYRAKGKSNKEAMEIGRGTAANVYRAQQAKKRKK